MNLDTKFPVIPMAVLAAAVLLVTWPLGCLDQILLLDDIFVSDLNNDKLPIRAFLGQALKSFDFPQWMPGVYGGLPTIAHIGNGACFPLNWVFYGLFPLATGHSLNLLCVFLIAATGMFFLCRRLDLDHNSALIGALAFGLNGYFIGHLRQLNLANAASLLPWLLWSLEWAWQSGKPSRLALTGVIFGLQTLAGHPQISYYCGIYIIIYFVALQCRELGYRDWLRSGFNGYFLASLAAGCLLAGVQLLPTMELSEFSRRAGGVSLEFASSHPYQLADITNFFAPYSQGDPSDMSYNGAIFWEGFAYCGKIPLILAVFTLILGFGHPKTKFFAATTLGAFLVVVGPATPLYSLLVEYIPGMDRFRFPSRCLLFVILALSYLAARGYRHLSARIPARIFTIIGPGLIAITVLDLWGVHSLQLPCVPAEVWLSEPSTVEKVRTIAKGSRYFSAVPFLTHIAAYRTAKGWRGSLRPYVEQREFLQPCLNLHYGLDAIDGYVNLVPLYVTAVWGAYAHEPGIVMSCLDKRSDNTIHADRAFTLLCNRFDIRAVLSPFELTSKDLEFVQRLGPVWLYRVPKTMGRFYIVPGYRVCENELQHRNLLLQTEVDPSDEVLLFEHPDMQFAKRPSGGDVVHCLVYEPERLVLDVDTPSGGLLVVADTWYPGWEAWVDGERKTILRANACQRAVALEAGKHRVEMIFRPHRVYWGLALSLIGLGLLIALGRRGRL